MCAGAIAPSCCSPSATTVLGLDSRPGPADHTTVSESPSTDRVPALDLIVCDDEIMISAVIVRRLRQEGHTVRDFPNGARAIEAARERVPDAILSDYEMPEMDGLQLARALAADPVLKTIPIFLITARGHRVPDEILAETGVVRIIPKPFSGRELCRIVGHEVQPRSPGNAA
jgi:chemosensory pili system protein ChpA (sensor histidine kinase/response regulator)